jgi:hypothetical protein
LNRTDFLKIALGVVLFPPLFLLAGMLWWGAATDPDAQTRAILGAVAAFLSLLGLLAGRILLHSPQKYLDRFSVLPLPSEDFVACALSYFRSRSRTLLICCLSVMAMSIFHLTELLTGGSTWYDVLLMLAFGVMAPMGVLWQFTRGELGLLLLVRGSAHLGFSERLQAVYQIAAHRSRDPVAQLIQQRIAAEYLVVRPDA